MENAKATDVTALGSRLHRLERKNRWLWVALTTLAAASLGGRLSVARAAQAPGAVLSAERFILTAADGTKRGEWRLDGDGAGQIVLYSADGKRVGELPLRARAIPVRP